MGEFRYIPPDEVAQRHRARNAETLPRQAPRRQAQQRNVEVVLSLGDVRYIEYRTRAYRIPPVPFKRGQRVLDTYTRALTYAKEVTTTGKKEQADAFYREMSKLVGLLWQHIRPTGTIKRSLWYVGLLRNPFRDASEAEIKQITDFFLQGRMTSSVRSMSEAEIQA
jgi:hypothetical protein